MSAPREDLNGFVVAHQEARQAMKRCTRSAFRSRDQVRIFADECLKFCGIPGDKIPLTARRNMPCERALGLDSAYYHPRNLVIGAYWSSSSATSWVYCNISAIPNWRANPNSPLICSEEWISFSNLYDLRNVRELPNISPATAKEEQLLKLPINSLDVVADYLLHPRLAGNHWWPCNNITFVRYLYYC